MKFLKESLYHLFGALMAGFCIGVGGIVFLMQTDKVIGAFLFAVGLLTILIFGFKLFTGMVGYLAEHLLERDWGYLWTLLVVWLGNLGGAALAALAVGATRLGVPLRAACASLVETKLTDGCGSLLLLGLFCGMLMYIAVDTYKKQIASKDFLCVIAVFMGVMVFILAGFEHSIADMFYFFMSGRFTEALPALLWITLGNSIGGNILPIVQKLMKLTETKAG